MTKQRFDKHSTEFGLWVRIPEELDSKKGFVATNIDFFWKNWITGKFMIIEEKRYMSEPAKFQHYIFQQLHNAFKNDSNYLGFHLLQFEKTSPEDGRIYWDKKEITKEKLIELLVMRDTGAATGLAKAISNTA